MTAGKVLVGRWGTPLIGTRTKVAWLAANRAGYLNRLPEMASSQKLAGVRVVAVVWTLIFRRTWWTEAELVPGG